MDDESWRSIVCVSEGNQVPEERMLSGSVYFFRRDGDRGELHALTHSFPTRRSSDLTRKKLVMSLLARKFT